MAAGLGSRYGGLKQLDTIDSYGHSIIDYSIYDACNVGFDHIVFIIRKELQPEFENRFARYETSETKISYVFQELADVPNEFKNIERQKPWGTGHALLALRNHVKHNFAIINADDFYGREAFEIMYEALANIIDDNNFAMVSYKLQNTLSPFGPVSRGQCFVDDDQFLLQIIERTKIKKKGNTIEYFKEHEEAVSIDGESQVSMNFWGFSPSIFDYAKPIFKEFLSKNTNNLNSEFYMPSVVNELMLNNTIKVKLLNTGSPWYGITYKEDKQHVIEAIEGLSTTGIYPAELWKNTALEAIFNEFEHNEVLKSIEPLTSGHINDTYRIVTGSGNDFVLQRINTDIFPKVEELMNNKVCVSQYLKGKSHYETSSYIRTKNEDHYYLNNVGNYWTLSTFIKNTTTFLVPINEEMAKQAGTLLGVFHKNMQGFEVKNLHETIPNFHNLEFRTRQFEDAIESAGENMINGVRNELTLINLLRKDAEYLHRMKTSDQVPLRVVHNDAKLSNILFDKTTLEAMAIIDLDTVMPGIIHYDIGDAIRSICSQAEEDETDASKILFNMDYYKAFMEGFIPIIKSSLTIIERETLVLGIKYMVFEQGLRFLTDYLNGNIYYKVTYPDHNLTRAKNQLKLLQVITERFDDIESITNEILKR